MNTSDGGSEGRDGERSDRLGEIVESYRLVSVLGSGSTSVVYLGERLDDPQAVAAVKVLTFHEAPGPSDRATFRTRFLREARAASKLRHDHILPVLSYGEVDDLTYMIMPVVGGGTLATRLANAQGPLPLPEVADDALQLASALDYAHEQGIVHRDVKPSNVLLDEHGQLYLTDFGIARLFDSGANALTVERVAALTVTGQVLGTPYYMAPEQIKGEPVGPATDVYALGVVLYQLATGQVPYQGDTPLTVALQHLQDDPCPPSLLRQEMPMGAESALVRALAKQPADRFASAGALAQAFERGVQEVQPADWRDSSNDTRPASSFLGLGASGPGASGKDGASGRSSSMSVYSSIRSMGPYHQLVGTTVGSYKLEQLLAVTDIGPIFRARSAAEGTPYRLRLLTVRADLPAESRSMLLGRFQQVAHNVAELQHPYILPLLDYGSAKGMPYLVSPHVAGPTLTERLTQTGPLELLAAGRYLDQMSAGLEFAHEHGILHRNLTSDCVYVQGANELVVADFEARRMFELGGPGAPKSTLYLDSEACTPEQLQGKSVDTYTDVYALGAVLYRMLTGRPLYGGSTRDDIAQQHLHAPIPPMRRARAGLPAGLENVVARALAKDPEQRYRHPSELSNAYRALVGSASTGKFAAGARPAVRESEPSEQPALVTPAAQVAERAAEASAGPVAEATLAASPFPAGPAASPMASPAQGGQAGGGAGSAPAATGAAALAASPPGARDGAVAGGAAPPPLREAGTGGPPAAGRGDAGGGWRRAARDPRGRAVAIVAAVLLLALLGWALSRAFIHPGVTATTSADVNFLDNGNGPSGASDALTITSSSLPEPPSGSHYGAWMIDDGSEHVTPLGNVVKQSDGSWALRFNGGGTNLVGASNRLLITQERDNQPAPAPSQQHVLQGAFPPEAFAHVKHLLVSFPTTPNEQGLHVGLLRQAQVVNDQAQLLRAFVDRNAAFSVKCEAQSVLDVLEGKGGANYRPLPQECQNRLIVQVGDGHGILGKDGYIEGVIDHATLASQSPDATPMLKEHASHVQIAAEDARKWYTMADQEALAILNGDNSTVKDMTHLINLALNGQDTNGDESIDPVPDEAGVVQGYHHAQLLATLELVPPPAK